MKLTPKELEGKSRKIVMLRKNGSRYVASINNDPSMTDQSFAEDADANTVMQKFMKTRDPALFPNKFDPEHVQDLSNMPQDLLSATLLVQDANQTFMELPARVRERFHNDPIQLLNFVKDENNRKEAISLGLIPETPTAKVQTENDVLIVSETTEGRQKKPKTVVVSSDD